MGTPHKHAAVIKAWADGAEIEYRDLGNMEWYMVTSPSWCPQLEYRIKPQPVKTGGYKRFLNWYMGKPNVFIAHEKNIGNRSVGDPAFIESNNYFIRWIDTEWQYETVEVE